MATRVDDNLGCAEKDAVVFARSCLCRCFLNFPPGLRAVGSSHFAGAMGVAEMFAWGVPAVLVLLHLHLLFLADLEEEIARAKDFGFGPLFDAPAV